MQEAHFANAENKLETFEKLFSMIQSGWSIYSHFLKPLNWELEHQALSNEDDSTLFFYKKQ